MKSSFNYQSLDVLTFARQAGHLRGTIPLCSLMRLQSSCDPLEPLEALTLRNQPNQTVVNPVLYQSSNTHVSWQAIGHTKTVQGKQQWLIYLQAKATVPLICQRCLGTFWLTLEIDRCFRFLPTEQEAALEDAQSEDEVLVLSQAFDLSALIEDELLLALPCAPRHDVCEVPKTEALANSLVDASSAFDSSVPPHPFAVLAQLKKLKT